MADEEAKEDEEVKPNQNIDPDEEGLPVEEEAALEAGAARLAALAPWPLTPWCAWAQTPPALTQCWARLGAT